MADPKYQKEQWDQRFAPHVREINEFVDDLKSDDKWLPYVAPMYGGVNARLLSLLRDPGPKTQEGKGSGFLSVENDDPTAQALGAYYIEAGIEISDVVPWNAYPWYINTKPKQLLRDGTVPLFDLLKILPHIQIVMLHGDDAQTAWKHLEKLHGPALSERKLQVIKTYHTSRQALFCKPDERRVRRAKLKADFALAAYALRTTISQGETK